MNITTTTYNSNFFYVRPDISLNRDSNDYFCPDDITEITVAPFLYVRMDKAGKAVQSKFASRYYSSVGYGINLTAKSLIDAEHPESFLMANSLDNSTFVSQLYKTGLFPLEILKQSTIKINGNATNVGGAEFAEPQDQMERVLEMFHRKIESVSRLTSFKTGDYIAIETAPHQPVQIGDTIEFGELKFRIK